MEFVAAYRRGAPTWSAAEVGAARALASADTAWVFSNSEAIGHLFGLLPDAADALRSGTAVATHPRIAATARAAGFHHVLDTAPGIDGVALTLQQSRRESTAAGGENPSIESAG